MMLAKLRGMGRQTLRSQFTLNTSSSIYHNVGSTMTTLRYKMKLRPKDETEDAADDNVSQDPAEGLKDWDKNQLTEDDIEQLVYSPALEYQRKLEALMKRDLTYGDAFPATSRSVPAEQDMDEDLFDMQFGLDAKSREISDQALNQRAEREGSPVLFNNPRINTGMPTFIDPYHEQFAKFKGQQPYKKNIFRYSSQYENMLDSEEAKREFYLNMKRQITDEQDSLGNEHTDDDATLKFLEHEYQEMQKFHSESGVAEFERIENALYGEQDAEDDDLLLSLGDEKAEEKLADRQIDPQNAELAAFIDRALDEAIDGQLDANAIGNEALVDKDGDFEGLEDGEEGLEEDREAEEDDEAFTMDGVKNWRLATQFKNAKYDNAFMNQQEYPEIFTLTAPERVTQSDLTKIYIIPQNEYTKYYGELGLGGELDQAFEKISQRALMIREPVLPVINYLTEMKSNKFTRKDLKTKGFVFTGIRGGGKSACLATVVHHAFKNNFLVFYIPSLRYWTHGVHYVEPSVLLKGYFDTPIPAEKFMRHFEKANSHLTQKMKLSQNYNLPVEVGEKQPSTISELIKFAISSEDNIEVGFKLLMDELHFNKEVPMLFAVDDFNFYNDWTYFHYGNLADFDTKNPDRVHASKLTLVRGLNRILLENSPKKFFAAATSAKWEQPNPPKLEEFVLEPLNVTRYNELELDTIVNYYESAFYLFNMNDYLLQDLTYLTGAVPGKVFKEVSFH